MRKLIEGLPNQSAAVAYQAVTGLRGRELPAAIASTIMQRRPRAHGLLQRAAEAVWVRPPAAITRAYQKIDKPIRARWSGRGERSTAHIALDAMNRNEGLRGGWTVFAKAAVPRVSLRRGPSMEVSPLWSFDGLPQPQTKL